MARRGGRSNTGAASRDPLRSLEQSLLTPLPSRPIVDLVPSADLTEIEDGRSWHPDPEPGALTLGGRLARVVVHRRPLIARANTMLSASSYPVGLQVPVGVRFESPFKVLTCLRRKVRREVIFARQKFGKGVRKRKPRRTWRSNVSC